MKWLERFTLVMQVGITTLREKVEDPERMLHQLIIDMEEELELVREVAAEAIADEIQLGRLVQKARDEADRITAPERKALADRRAEALRQEYEMHKRQAALLEQSVRDLEDKIRQARHKQTLLLARLTRAESTLRVNWALDRAQSGSTFSEFRRLEEQVERAEALGEAYDRLEGRGPDAEELSRPSEAAEHREALQKEFEELKRRVEGVEGVEADGGNE